MVNAKDPSANLSRGQQYFLEIGPPKIPRTVFYDYKVVDEFWSFSVCSDHASFDLHC